MIHVRFGPDYRFMGFGLSGKLLFFFLGELLVFL